MLAALLCNLDAPLYGAPIRKFKPRKREIKFSAEFEIAACVSSSASVVSGAALNFKSGSQVRAFTNVRSLTSWRSGIRSETHFAHASRIGVMPDHHDIHDFTSALRVRSRLQLKKSLSRQVIEEQEMFGVLY